MDTKTEQHRKILQKVARQAMLERGLEPDFSDEALAELEGLEAPAAEPGGDVRDMRSLLWASIDNEDSRDLDQLSVAEALPDGQIRVLVAIADVDALVKKGTALDQHARQNTTTVYTTAKIFPMLPERISTDLTSLNAGEDRVVMVVEMVVAADGSLIDSDVYRAVVHNHARLSYNPTAAWLEADGEPPEEIAAVPGLAENLRLQDTAAQRMKKLRFEMGALDFETIEARPVFVGDTVQAVEVESKNRAKEIIQDFMIATNGVTARFLSDHGYPSIRRVISAPERWDRIVAIAEEYGDSLPHEPDSLALNTFLERQKEKDPLRFPDLSLSIIKLIGGGEYQAERPDNDEPDHFSLAVEDYAHSTAPNRRYTDLITQRLLKAAIQGGPPAYDLQELEELAAHCTQQEDEATKVQRQVAKAAMALLLEDRIGEEYEAIATGASPKGTWVRLVKIPVEGKLVAGEEGVDVGDRLRVELIGVKVERGFIDFKRVRS